MTIDIGAVGKQGLIWSAVRNWASRIIGASIFVILARLLSPLELGVASAAILVITTIGVLAEVGFGDAIIQRGRLQSVDVNLPFAASLTISLLLSTVVAVLAGSFEVWLDAPGLAPILVVLCTAAPLTTVSIFQEVMYRRAFDFKKLAIRVLLANTVGGIVAIALAFAGAGVWTLVAQYYVTAVVGLVWLWWKPLWSPRWEWDTKSFYGLSRFAAPVISVRVIDLVAMRAIELLIIREYGIVAFGFYSVGRTLYDTMMRALQSVVADISLPILSRIAEDRTRLAQVYLKTIQFAAFFATPVFVLFAALSPEIYQVLFGTKWTGSDAVSQALLLMGAVQIVQYVNGPYVSARGRPAKLLVLQIAKYAILVFGLLVVPSSDLSGLIALFAFLQVVVAPLSFAVVAHELRQPIGQVVRAVFPCAIGCVIAFYSVAFARPIATDFVRSDFLSGLVLGCVFAAAYLIVVLVVAPREFLASYWVVAKRFVKGPQVGV